MLSLDGGQHYHRTVDNMNTWSEWFATNRSHIGPSWLQSVEYMYPVYNHIYQLAPPPRTLLEIGCGMGDSARALSIMGYNVVGIDNDPAILSVVHNHPVHNGNIHFELGDAYHPPHGFNIATSFGIIEHVGPISRINMLHAMAECATLLAVTIPSPILCNTVTRSMGEYDISLRQLQHECLISGWSVRSKFGWGIPPKYRRLHDITPPRLWRRFQYHGLFSLSFCVIGIGYGQ